jgi:HSP20 family molecular chaperone IbpA
MTTVEQLVYEALRDLGPLREHVRKNAYTPAPAAPTSTTQMSSTSDEHLITRVIPGIKKEDVSVTCEGNTLCIETKSADAPAWATGYANNKWNYTLLPDSDIKGIEAKHVDGILTVRVPRLKKKMHVVTIN